MSRNLARRGASVLVAAAVLGGGLALGGGTASAAEPDPYPVFSGPVDAVIRVILFNFVGPVLDSGSAAVGSTEPCSGGWEGVPTPGCIFDIRVLPTELASMS